MLADSVQFFHIHTYIFIPECTLCRRNKIKNETETETEAEIEIETEIETETELYTAYFSFSQAVALYSGASNQLSINRDVMWRANLT